MTPDPNALRYEDRDEAWKQLVVRLSELGVHFGLFNAVMERYPPHVQDGFLERINDAIAWCDQQVSEIQDFGDAYDSE